ncbi:MAG: phospholipase D-like domain-containing protein [Vulcanimicrobiota bacterium]
MIKKIGSTQINQISQRSNSLKKENVSVKSPDERKLPRDEATITQGHVAGTSETEKNENEVSANQINKFTPLIGDTEFTADVMKEVGNAKKSVYFETYLLNGKDGKAFADLLVKKKKEGLDVKVILDPSAQKLSKLIHRNNPEYGLHKYLTDNGVESVTYPVSKMKGYLVPTDHAKVCIVDDHISYLGGSNIDDTYNHDINVKIEGPATQDVKAFFEESWKVSTSPDKKELGYISDPKMRNKSGFKLTTTSPSRSTIKPAILENIKNARKSIKIEMFTFTDDDLEQAVIDAKKRGVDVRIILGGNREIFHLPTGGVPNIAAAVKFKKAGVPVKWYKNDEVNQLHSKACIFDEEKVMLGSANFIHGAFDGIHEYYGEINDKDFAGKINKQFEKDWEKYSVDVKQPGLKDRLLAGTVEALDDFLL